MTQLTRIFADTHPVDAQNPDEQHLSRQTRTKVRSGATFLTLILIGVSLTTLTYATLVRWELTGSTNWLCDEIPLLVRCTGLCGVVNHQSQADDFVPGYYSFYMGALRSLRPPKYLTSLHPTAAFWTNLTIHLFGCSPTAGRAMPLMMSLLATLTVAGAVYLACGSLVGACGAAVVIALSPHVAVSGAQARGYAEAVALTPILLICLEMLRRRPRSLIGAVFTLLVAAYLAVTVYTMWVYWVFPVVGLTVALERFSSLYSEPALTRTVAWENSDSPVQCNLSGAPGLGTCADATGKVTHFLRFPMGIVFFALLGFMALYTIDRWQSFAFLSHSGGMTIDGLGPALSFLDDLTDLLIGPAFGWVSVLAVLGLTYLWRSDMRWWAWAIGIGLAVPMLFTIIRGSPGYPRNLGHLIAPLAITVGLGWHVLHRFLAKRWGLPLATGVVILLLTTGGATTAIGLKTRARHHMPPDWGSLSESMARAPETVGPRWFFPCLANHWQINWYQPRDAAGRIWQVSIGETVELVLGGDISGGLERSALLHSEPRALARADDRRLLNHRDVENRQTKKNALAASGGSNAPGAYAARVFNLGPQGDSIIEQPMPAYLASVSPWKQRNGVELRHWIGRRIEPRLTASANALTEASTSTSKPETSNTLQPINDDTPFFLVFPLESQTARQAWPVIWKTTQAQSRGVIAFKFSNLDGRQLMTLLGPRSVISATCEKLQEDAALSSQDIRLFSLSTFEPP